jgi:hypothetical protein
MPARRIDRGTNFGVAHRSCNEIRVGAASENYDYHQLHGVEIRQWTLDCEGDDGCPAITL